MPGRKCTVCTHPDHEAIDAEICRGTTLAKIARAFEVHELALLRHRDKHLAPFLQSQKAAAEAAMDEDAPDPDEADLLKQARNLHRKALGLMHLAQRERDIRAALQGVREATRLIELQGKLLGTIGGKIANHTTVNIGRADFQMIQVQVVQALDRFPEAKIAVLKALGAEL
jgi:hypothetical protein